MQIEFTNDRGMTIAGILDFPEKEGKFPTILLLSHFTGFKELTHLSHLAKALVEKNFCVLRFDFSDCVGKSEGTCEDMTLMHQVRDTFSAIDFLETQDKVDSNKIGVAGHSLGGTTAIVSAANDSRIKAIVNIAGLASAKWDVLFKEKVPEWEETGFITFKTFTKGEVKIKYGFYKDLKKYSASEIVKQVHVPIRIIHGDNDKIVPLKNGEEIFKNANEPKDLHIVKDADHMFSNNEPEMIQATIEWFEKYLN